VAGGRIFYLLETDPGALLRPADLFGTQGFAFGGRLILAAIAIAGYPRRRRLTRRAGQGITLLDDRAAEGPPLQRPAGR
jgi:prolipoprotein diacylglyceryltransferase